MKSSSSTAGISGSAGLEELLQQMISAYRHSIELFDAQIRAVINGNVSILEESTSDQLEQQELLQQLEARLRYFMESNSGTGIHAGIAAGDNAGKFAGVEPRPLRHVLEESGQRHLIESGNELVQIINRALDKRDQLTGLLEFARSHTNDMIRMIYGSVSDGADNYTQNGTAHKQHTAPMAINKRI